MVSIWHYGYDLLGLSKCWQFDCNVEWGEYERMAQSRPGEGSTWRADFKL